MKRFSIGSLVLALVIVLVSCGPRRVLGVAGEIADNYAAFFSIKHDREDIKEGTFKLSPWSGDTFEMNLEATPIIRQEEITSKRLSNNGTVLSVKTDTQYWLEELSLSPVMVREINIQIGRGKVSTVLVNIHILGARMSIDRRTAEALRKIPANGGQHRFLVEVKKLSEFDGYKWYSSTINSLNYLNSQLRPFAWGSKSEKVHLSVKRDVGFLYLLPMIYEPEDVIFQLPVRILEVDGVRVRAVDPLY